MTFNSQGEAIDEEKIEGQIKKKMLVMDADNGSETQNGENDENDTNIKGRKNSGTSTEDRGNDRSTTDNGSKSNQRA